MQLLQIQAAIGTAVLLLASPSAAKHGHSHSLQVLGRRHNHLHHRQLHATRREESSVEIQKRATCAFPTDKGLVSVTPNLMNGGWAMSPDEPCAADTWCPYACQPGDVMNQWDPQATTYSYPLSMHGGLYCDRNGQLQVPFPDRPYCVKGTGAVKVDNRCKGQVSFCQTLLPGNEAMLIPTAVDTIATLAVPDPSYWASTAAHYYINTPGVGVQDACVWGTASKAIGNWAHYVAGANTDNNGMTFAKIGWNPTIFETSLYKTAPPSFGLRFECDGPCVGLPCEIDGTQVGQVTSANAATGAGGANFCVVTIPKGSTARIVVFPVGSDNSGSGKPSDDSQKPTPKPSPTPSPTPTPTPTPTPVPSSTKSSSSTQSTSSSTSSSSSSDGSSSANTTVPISKGGNAPHVLFQNKNDTAPAYPTKLASQTDSTSPATAVPVKPAAATTSKKNSADVTVSSSFFSFAIALVATGLFL